MNPLPVPVDGISQKSNPDWDRHPYYWNHILRYCDYFSNASLSVLEIGCGEGHLIGNITGRHKVGVDTDAAAIEKARERFAGVHFHHLTHEALEGGHTYDLIIVSNLVGYLTDVQGAFEQMRRLCHARTKIIITYYNYLWEPVLKLGEWIGIKRPTRNQNWLSQSDLKNLLHLSGYEVYRETRRMLLPVNIWGVSWFFNTVLARLPLLRGLSLSTFTFARPLTAPATDSLSVSIVIPARNESGNIENALRHMPRFGTWQEIIFVEGGSTDNTWQTIQEMAARYGHLFNIKYLRQRGTGKNDAVKAGFEVASGDLLMILDADLTVPPEDLVKFYHAVTNHKGDFIFGCRLVYQMDRQAMRFLNLVANKLFGLIFSWLLDQPIKDTLCGTKVIRKDDYLLLRDNSAYFGHADPFGDFDLIFGAFKLNLRMVEIPIRYRERTYGTTNISRFRHGLLLLKMCGVAASKIKFR